MEVKKSRIDFKGKCKEAKPRQAVGRLTRATPVLLDFVESLGSKDHLAFLLPSVQSFPYPYI